MSKRYLGGVITKSPVTPNVSSANGIWTMEQQAHYRYSNCWPRSPGAPSITSVTKGNANVAVAFSAPSCTGSNTLTSYIATSNTGVSATNTTSPITVTGLTNGSSYTFVVRGINSAGTGACSARSAVAIPSTVPNAPTIGTATGSGCTAAVVTFTGSTCNGGNTITGYTVTSTPGSYTGTGTSSPITVSGLNSNCSYTFKVKAQNANGFGPCSSASNSVSFAPPYLCISVSGTSITTCGSYKYAKFTGAGSFTVNKVGTDATYGNKIWYLVVAGGGGGGANCSTYGQFGQSSGGGGAGGWRSNCGYSQTVTARTYSVAVGGGGGGYGYNGNNSSIACIVTSCGGGGGGDPQGISYPRNGQNGGSGGGGASSGCRTSGGSGGSGQGYAGGGGYFNGCKAGTANQAGGGGGAAGSGQCGQVSVVAPYYRSYYGCGGCGKASSITGSSVTYAGGGGGGGYYGRSGYPQGNGGSGGGGNGKTCSHTTGSAGVAYTGSGGGGATYANYGYGGGTGVVIIRWRFQ